MTSEEFRNNQLLVAEAIELLNHSTMKVMLEVMEEEGPANYRIPLRPGSDDGNHQLGCVWGYSSYRRRLLELAEPAQNNPNDNIDVTWSAEREQ